MARLLLSVSVAFVVVFSANTSFAQNTVNCTPAQISTIMDAQSVIAGRIDGALTFVADGPHYERWFGAFDSGRADIVRDNLGTLKAYALISQPEYTCVAAGQGACSPGTLAYVAVGASFEMSLCDACFDLNSVGTDSTWGTLLHEMSHFALGPATDDECYGSVGIGTCIDLALNDPDAAVRNADSYQYFVETSPL